MKKMFVISDKALQAELDRIVDLKKSGEINRNGAVFCTENNNYFYDSGTGKVARLDDVAYDILISLFDNTRSVEELNTTFEISPENEVRQFLSVCIQQNLLRMPVLPRTYKPLYYDYLGELVNEQLEQVTLEVTEKCNFRCKYCIYNEDYNGDRNFGTADMSWATAKKSVDYAIEHSAENIAITYYGGEPLIQFDLIKKCTDYARKIGIEKNLSFSLTSNMTLLTKEMAEYFAGIPQFNVVASVDGAEKYHNKTRVYTGNKPSFDDTMRGLKLLAEAFKDTNKPISINNVIVPPYSFEMFSEINNFYKNIDFLSEQTNISITYATPGTYDASKDYLPYNMNPKYLVNGEYDPLTKWQYMQVLEHGLSYSSTKDIYTQSMINFLRTVHTHRIGDIPMLKTDNPNGCCVPGSRRLYVQTNGDLLICERIGSSPIVGNINTGVDNKLVKEMYIDKYITDSYEDCSKCWAFNLCPVCYAKNYNDRGLDKDAKRLTCETGRKGCFNQLSIYFSLLEKKPNLMKIYDEVTFM